MRLLILAEVFHTRCLFVDFSHQSVFVSLRALELMSVQFPPFDFDVTSFARRVRRLSRDRRCENNHRHHIDIRRSQVQEGQADHPFSKYDPDKRTHLSYCFGMQAVMHVRCGM